MLNRVLATFPCPPRFGSVDDTRCALATSDIDQFHQHINSVEHHIQFTTEIETNAQEAHAYRQIPGLLIPPPQTHKAAVVRTLMNRAQSLPSSISTHTDEEVQVTTAHSLIAPPSGYQKHVHPSSKSMHLAPIQLRPAALFSHTLKLYQKPFTES